MKTHFKNHMIYKTLFLCAFITFCLPPLGRAESVSQGQLQNANQSMEGRQQQDSGQNPFLEMQKIQRNMDELFDQSMQRMNAESAGNYMQPSMDFQDAGDHFIVTMDLPGMKKDQIKIDAAENMLSVSGERQTKKEENEKNFYSMERSFGAFQRNIPLPEKILTDKVSAKYEDGVLEIALPKASPSKRQEKMTAVKVQ